MKFLLKTLLLIFIFTSIAYASPQDKKDETVSIEAETSMAVYYFHGKRRCITCVNMENYAKESLDANFSNEMTDKKIQWKVTNISLPENQHFIEDYSLVSQSLVLVKQEKGKRTEWKNLDKIWQLVRDEESYKNYVRDNVKEFMEKIHE